MLAKDNASGTFRNVGNEAELAGKKVDGGLTSIGKGVGAAGAAFAGLGIGAFLKDAIGSASDLSETLNKSSVIFGENAGELQSWAKESARSFGLSKGAAVDAATGLGNMLSQLGYTGDAALEASTSTVKLAADLGSFNNLETGDVLDKISGAMRGEYDSLQALIPNINAARVENEAMAATGKKTAAELTAQEKATATLAIIQKDGAAAADDFAETSGGLANQTKIAAAEFEDFKATLGQAFLPVATESMSFISDTAIPALEGMFDTAASLAGAFGDLPGSVQIGIAAFGLWMAAGDQIKGVLSGFSGGLTPVKDASRAFGDALDYARAKGDGFGTVLRSVGDYAGGQALTALKNLGRAIGPELAIAAGAFVVSEVVSGFQSMTGASDKAAAAADGFADALKATNGIIDDSSRAAAQKALIDADLVDAFDRAGVSARDAIDGLLGHADAQDRVNAALQGYITANPGGVHNDEAESVRLARQDYEELAATLGMTKEEAKFFADAATGAADGTDKSGNAAETAAPKVDTLTAAFDATKTAVDDGKKAIDNFKLSLDILSGAHVSMIEVESAFQAALDSAKGSMEGLDGAALDVNGNLDLQSAAGRTASDVLLDVRNSGNDLIATMIQQGATTEDVMAKDASLRDSFIKTAGEMGISQEAALGLADQILGIPGERETKITADVTQASGAVSGLQEQIDNIAKDRVASINFRATLPDLNGAVSGSGRPGAATGGYITGPGSGTSDSIPVNLSNGEYVIKASRVRDLGVDKLHGLNEGRLNFADGGLVSLLANADTAGASASIAKVNDDFLRAANTAARQNMEPGLGMVAALQWAKSQVGKPYLWGSAGPSGFDCSGFMSAITNVIRGRNPNSRLGSTASFPWSGFTGGDGPFTIGSTPNAGNGIGHMAGTLLGVNVESRGGQGVVVGASARGASDRLFGQRAHLATYDDGGWLQPGYTMAYNGTGQPERIRTAGQEAALSDGQVVINARVFIGDREITDIARVEAERVTAGAFGAITDRGAFNG